MATYELTEAQKAKLVPTRDKWMAHGVDCNRANAAETERGVQMAYKAHGFTAPTMLCWFRSPLEGTIAAAMVDSLKVEKYRNLPSDVLDSIHRVLNRHGLRSNGLRSEYYRAIAANTPEQHAERIASEEEQAVAPWERVRPRMVRYLTTYLLKKNHNPRIPPKGFDQAILDEIYDEVFKKCFKTAWAGITRQKLDEQLSSCCYGQHDANWLSFFSFFRIECNAPEVQNIEGLEIVCQNCGWWWPFRGLAIMTDRPLHIDRDEENRLHSENRMAIRYPDGFGFYMWHGTRIAPRIIEQADEITSQEIVEETNMEIRRIMIEKCGIERLLDAARLMEEVETGWYCANHSGRFVFNPKTRNDCHRCYAARPADAETIQESLWKLPMRDDEDVVMCKVKNSSPEPDGHFKTYVLRVPPRTQSLQEGIAWSFGYEGKSQTTYVPTVET